MLLSVSDHSMDWTFLAKLPEIQKSLHWPRRLMPCRHCTQWGAGMSRAGRPSKTPCPACLAFGVSPGRDPAWSWCDWEGQFSRKCPQLRRVDVLLRPSLEPGDLRGTTAPRVPSASTQALHYLGKSLVKCIHVKPLQIPAPYSPGAFWWRGWLRRDKKNCGDWIPPRQ